MSKFAKNIDPQAIAERQASNIMKELQGSVLSSVGTVRNYEERLSVVAKTINQQFGCGLKQLTVEQAQQYLSDRASEVGQKTLDMERQSIQCMMQNVTGKLSENEKLTVVKSEHQQVLSSRSYSPLQIQMVMSAQTEKNSLSTALSHAAGLRAHELYTLEKANDRGADARPALSEKFQGREGVLYTVQGKGGLVRDVLIPHELAQRLEQRRLETSKTIIDRGIEYQTHYDINGGNRWSSSFSSASSRTLNWSAGAHGMRHTYAQERMQELQKTLSYDKALEVVSQEMGHFRANITKVYLR